jgi:hypothetical protein
MAEYQIVLEVGAAPEALQIVDKDRKVGIQGQLMYLLVHTGSKVDKSCILAESIYLTVLRIVDTSVDIDHMSLFAQFGGNLPNIDAHTSSIFGTQFAHGTTMGTQHTYSQLTKRHQGIVLASAIT